MIKIFKTLFIVLVITNIQPSNAKELTESSVKEFIEIFDNAVESKDLIKIADLMVDDVNIITNVTFLGQTEVINSSKTEYISLLKESWKLTTDYSFTRNEFDIVFENDTATISGTITESMSLLGEPVSVQSEGEAKIRIVNEKLQFVEIISHTSM